MIIVHVRDFILAKIAIYGGTFDPIHKGHLHVITEIISRQIADRILLIPAGQPRLRDQAPIASGPDRHEIDDARLRMLLRSGSDAICHHAYGGGT